MKGDRKIIVNGKEYTYMIGRSNVVIRNEEKKIVVDFSTLTGISWPNIERGQWKKYFHIQPHHVANFIKGVKNNGY